MGKHELLESRTVRGVFYLIYLNLMSKKNRKCVRSARNMLQIDVTRFKRVTFSFINYIAILQISIILLVFVKFIKKSRICQNVFNCKLLCSLRALWFKIKIFNSSLIFKLSALRSNINYKHY